jgi:hypothetical protein
MTPMKWLTALFGILGLLALIAAIMYFTIAAHSLPSFLGPIHSHVAPKAHRKRRGEAAIAAAVVLWVIAGIIYYVGRRTPAVAAGASGGAGQPVDQTASDQPAS